MSQKENK